MRSHWPTNLCKVFVQFAVKAFHSCCCCCSFYLSSNGFYYYMYNLFFFVFFVHLCVVAVVVAVVVDVIIILCLHLLRWNYCSSARLYHPHDLHPFFTAHCLHTFLFDGCCWCRHCNGDGVERGGGAVGVQFGELLRIKPKSKSTPIIPHAYTHTRT